MESESSHFDCRIEEGLTTPVSTRRSFFIRATSAIAAFIGLSLSMPLFGYVVGPAFRRRKAEWVPIAQIDDLPVGTPQALDYSATIKDGWHETEITKAVWVIKHDDRRVTAFAPLCTHLGCGYRWENRKRQFQCPCHGSVYDIEGNVMAGPAPRPLDQLPVKIEHGEVSIIYKEYKTGLPERVEV